MRFNHYKLKDGVKRKNIEKCGGIKEGDNLVILKYIPVTHSEICVRLTFGKTLENWNDDDFVDAIDSDADHPYKPFYKYHYSDIVDNPSLEKFVTEYNSFMDSLPILVPAN